MNKFDTLLFDLDGTLTDSFEGIINCVEYALSRMGEKKQERSSLTYFIGPPLIESFTYLFGGDGEKAERAVSLYRERYSALGWAENRVYDGIEETLAALKKTGKTLVVATGKPEDFSVRIIEKFGLKKYFSLVAGASLDRTRDTKDKVIAYAMEKAACYRTRTVMIGDRKHDILGAKANGIKSIGVLYGYGSREELTAAGADFIVSAPKDIIGVVE